MYSLTYKGQKIFNPVEGKEQELIDLFVDYYGKKHKKRIEERILNNKFIFVSDLSYEQSIDFYVHFFENQIQKLTNEAIKVVSEKDVSGNKISINQIEYISNSLKNKTIDSSNYKIIKNLANIFNVTKNEKLNNKSNLADVMKWCENSQNTDELKEKINQTIDYWKKNYSKECKTLVNERRNIIAFFMKNKENMKNLNKETVERELEIVKNYLKENTKIQEKDLNKYTKIYYSILCKGDVEFSRLNYKPKVTDQKYIEFFNVLGYKLGNSINKYKSNDRLRKKLFSNKLIKLLEDSNKKEIEEQINANVYFKNFIENVDDLQVGYGNLHIVEWVYDFIFNPSRAAAFMIQYLNKNFTFKSLTVCKDSVISSNEDFIHELNHVVSSNIYKKNRNDLTFKVGLEIKGYPMPEENYTSNYDLYINSQPEDSEDFLAYTRYKIATFNGCLFMEIINDYTCLEIAKMAEERGLKICHGQNIDSSYSLGFPIFKSFIESHKKVIKECMMSDSIQILENYIGIDNYKKFSQIATVIAEENQINGKYSKAVLEIAQVLNVTPHMAYDVICNDISALDELKSLFTDNVLELITYYEEVKRISDKILEKQNKLKLVKEKNKLKEAKNKLKLQEQNKEIEMIELGK